MREMKESGVDWIGAIPASWKTRKNKYIFDILKRIAGREGYDILSVTQQGLRVKDIESGEGQLAKDYSGYQRVYPGDFVMNHMDLLTGWVDCSTLCGVTSPDYRVFRPKKSAPVVRSYFKYIFQYCYANKVFYNLGSGVAGFGRWRLQAPAFNNFVMPFPSLSEQERIADYLDGRCAAIDEVRRTIEDEVEALRRLRKAIIDQSISGFRKTCHVGYMISDIRTGLNPRDNFKLNTPDASNYYITIREMIDGWHILPSDKTDLVDDDALRLIANRSHLRVGDVLVSGTASIGKTALVDEVPLDWNIKEGIFAVTPCHEKLSSRFLVYWLASTFATTQMEMLRVGSTVASITMNAFCKLSIPVYALSEQQRIVSYLDERCAAIDSVIDTRTKQLARLEDYRKALVFACVTGKKEVPSHE